MASTALKQLSSLHREMYDKAYTEAMTSLGSESTSIRRYGEKFSKSLPDQFKMSHLRKLLQSIDDHKIVLYGDFHSHKQCQRGLLRVLRAYIYTPDHAPVTLAVEMFRQKDQEVLNQWQAGNISDEELLRRTDYNTIWGFPWENYKPLLEFCRSHGIRFIGMNTDLAGRDTLSVRDRAASKALKHYLQKNPKHKVFYIVGEYHLANEYLPKELTKLNLQNEILRIVANTDKYFFLLPEDKIHRSDEYLELNPSFYCIINSPPWIKWQSHVLNEELKRIGYTAYISREMSNLAYEDSYDGIDDDSFDIDWHLKVNIDHICRFLNIKPTNQLYDNFCVSPHIDNAELEHLPLFAREAFVRQASRDGVALEFKRKQLIMSDVSANHLAFAAGQIVFATLTDIQERYDDSQSLFCLQVLKQFVGALANKVVNPKISLQTYKSVEEYLVAVKGRRLYGPAKMRKEVAKAVLKFNKWNQVRMAKRASATEFTFVPDELVLADIESGYNLSRLIAHHFATSVYAKIVAGKIQVSDLSQLFTTQITSSADLKRRFYLLIQF